MHRLFFTFCISCLLASWDSNGAVMQSLYETRVLATGQTVSAQTRAFRESLQQVLVKVSGDNSIASDSYVRQQLPKARDFIRAFQYENDNGLTFMVASFDEDRVNELVIESGFPVWGRRRPDTLLWMAHWSENGERELFTAASEQFVKLTLLDSAQRRGIPVTFPLMDIQDSQLINVFDVWGRFDDTIKFASQRYPNDNLISARLFNRNLLLTEDETVPENMTWQLDWQILNEDLVQESTIFGPDMNTVVDEFVDFVADTLAAKYAVETEGLLVNGNKINLKIINMDSIKSYVTVSRFFESLALVNTVSLLRLEGEVGEFQLELTGNVSDLLNTLLLDDKISQKTDAFGRATDELEFFWLP